MIYRFAWFYASFPFFWAEIRIFNHPMINQKISIRFFNDREVRAVWDEELLEIPEGKIEERKTELVSITTQLKYPIINLP